MGSNLNWFLNIYKYLFPRYFFREIKNHLTCWSYLKFKLKPLKNLGAMGDNEVGQSISVDPTWNSIDKARKVVG